jgi:hypothetical protein
MPEKPNKTEQGRQKRAAEKAARAAATQGRRDSAAAAQERSEQRQGRNVDEGAANRIASFAKREAAAGLYLAGNDTISAGRGVSGPSFADREAANGLTNTTSGRVASKATNPDFPPVGTPVGNDEFTAANNVSGGGGGGGGGEFYAFKVVDDGDGTVSVTTGTVNTVTTTGLTPGGKPTALWLKVTFNASGEVTAASVQTASGGTSATQDYRQIATITWNGDVPTISQGIKGSQSIASCGATHQWGTLYS